jgi:hypothetical protein
MYILCRQRHNQPYMQLAFARQLLDDAACARGIETTISADVCSCGANLEFILESELSHLLCVRECTIDVV